MSIKAIATIYKGRRFRSRLEARWAIFFDAIDIGWEYEIEGFEIGNTKYLTDFKIQSFGRNKVDLYIEIKPNKPSYEEIQKCYEVSVGTNVSVALICGSPGLPEFSEFSENWNLKTGHVVLYFPSEVTLEGKEQAPPFHLWAESNRFSLFQTDPYGGNLDIWPIYFDMVTQGKVTGFNMLSLVRNGAMDMYSLNTFGSVLQTAYFSRKPDGRQLNHERILYGYQLALGARFEFDEFNLIIVDGFYRDLELIPFSKVYSSINNSFALYYNNQLRKFTSLESSLPKPPNTITLVKKSPPMIIKQFVENFPKDLRQSEDQVITFWKGFLFRYRIRLKDYKLKRVI